MNMHGTQQTQPALPRCGVNYSFLLTQGRHSGTNDRRRRRTNHGETTVHLGADQQGPATPQINKTQAGEGLEEGEEVDCPAGLPGRAVGQAETPVPGGSHIWPWQDTAWGPAVSTDHSGQEPPGGRGTRHGSCTPRTSFLPGGRAAGGQAGVLCPSAGDVWPC